MSHANGWLLVWIQSLPILWRLVAWTMFGLSILAMIGFVVMMFNLHRVIHWDKPKIKITWTS